MEIKDAKTNRGIQRKSIFTWWNELVFLSKNLENKENCLIIRDNINWLDPDNERKIEAKIQFKAQFILR